MNNADILASWESVKNTHFGKWLLESTEQARKEAISQLDSLNEMVPIARVQGFRQGLNYWIIELEGMRRQIDLTEKKRKSGLLARIGLGGH